MASGRTAKIWQIFQTIRRGYFLHYRHLIRPPVQVRVGLGLKVPGVDDAVVVVILEVNVLAVHVGEPFLDLSEARDQFFAFGILDLGANPMVVSNNAKTNNLHY
jgi:hypothetical protein